MAVTIEISDELAQRLSSAGLLSGEGIERLLGGVMSTQNTSSPLNRAYRTLFEQTHDAVFILSPEGRNIAINQRAVEMTGYSTAELMTMSFRDLTADVSGSNATYQALLSGEKIEPYERVFRKKSGELFIAEITAELVRDSQGVPLYIQSVTRDITQRKRAEDAVRESERLLRQIIDLAPVHIFAKDAHGRYILANRACAEDHGTTVDGMIGKTDIELAADPEQAKIYTEHDRRVLEEGALVVVPEVSFTDASGRRRMFRTVTMPLKFPDRDELSVLGISTDMTETKQAASEAYRQAYELAAERQHVQLLTQFIQDTSHEFRTPLSVIGTSLYLMTRTTDEGKRAAHANQASAQIKRITRLLEQLQTMAEVDGGIAFMFMPVSVNQVLREAVAHLPRPDDKLTIDVRLLLDDDVSYVSADPARLSQAFEQLLDNAIRFTPPDGAITIHTWADGDAVVVEIHDTGIGIPPEVMPFVTRRFWRLDSSHTTPGFGLGLPIAQNIVERHGGALTIASPEQAGTIVTIRLPLPPQP